MIALDKQIGWVSCLGKYEVLMVEEGVDWFRAGCGLRTYSDTTS